MKMIFEEKDKVIIMNSNKEYKEVSRQSIADYCTKKEGKYQDDARKVRIVPRHEDMPKIYESLMKEENNDKTMEKTLLLTYLPLIERITILPKDIILIKILNKATDIKLQISWSLYKFLNELQ